MEARSARQLGSRSWHQWWGLCGAHPRSAVERFLLWRSHKLHLREGTWATCVIHLHCSLRFLKTRPSPFPASVSCSETSGFIATSPGGSSLICRHGTAGVSTGSETGQFSTWGQGCCSWCVSSVEGKTSSSDCSAIQQGNQRRTSGFNWIISDFLFCFVFHVQLNIWMYISLRNFVCRKL